MSKRSKIAYPEKLRGKYPCAPCLLRLRLPFRVITLRTGASKDILIKLKHVCNIPKSPGASPYRPPAQTKEQIAAKQKARYHSLPLEVRTAPERRHYNANRQEISARKSQWQSEQLRSDPAARIKKHIRNTVRRMVRLGGQRQHSSSVYLGCTPAKAREHISRLLKPGMTWDNYGEIWEIDHIHPLSSFNLTIEAEALQAAHYTNLKPLLISHNRSKHNSIPANRQMALV